MEVLAPYWTLAAQRTEKGARILLIIIIIIIIKGVNITTQLKNVE